MKNFFIYFLLMFQVNIFSDETLVFDYDSDRDIVLNASETSELIIEGVITNIKTYTYYKKRRDLINLSDIIVDNLADVRVITELMVKVLDVFKGEPKGENIKIYVIGGCILLNGEKLCQEVTHTAYPFLDIGDQMIMGLKHTEDGHILSKLIDEYSMWYNFFHAAILQIPSSKDMIYTVEEARLNRVFLHLTREALRILEEELEYSEPPNNNNPEDKIDAVDLVDEEYDLHEEVSIADLIENYETALLEVERVVGERIDFVNYLKAKLRSMYE